MVAARLGWTPEQWGSLTDAQRVLLARAVEDRDARATEAVRDALANALANALRRRGGDPLPLYEDASQGQAMGHGEAVGKMRDIAAHMG